MQQRFSRLLGTLSAGVLERETALSLGLLALIAGESLFLLGPPGVAKSLVARRLKGAFKDARAFEYLMGRFSTPEEIFGPLSIAGLRDRDVFERKTAGYLPEADVAFLDEIWRSSPPIQNSLLTILNEKVFRNGGTELRVPLKLLVAASNGLPEAEENAEAFWDRFILRLEVGPVSSEEAFAALVSSGSVMVLPDDTAKTRDDRLDAAEWLTIQTQLDSISLPDEVLGALTGLRAAMANGPYVSDRRWKKAVRVLRASAFLHGRDRVDSLDLGLLEHMLWHRPEERPALVAQLRQTLGDFGWPSPVSLDDFEKRVETLRNELRTLTLKERRVTRPKPVLQDGEYHTVLAYPGALTAKVWAQDYALLKTDEELEGELFFFTPYGPFRNSEKHQLRATGAPAEIDIDGRLYALESRPEELVLWDKVLPDGQAVRAWEKRAEALAAELLQARQDLEALAETREASSHSHLFCGQSTPQWALACRESLDRDALTTGDLLVELETLIETRNPGDGNR